MAETGEGPEWLSELLKEVQLDQFYVKLRDNLQVTRYYRAPVLWLWLNYSDLQLLTLLGANF